MLNAQVKDPQQLEGHEVIENRKFDDQKHSTFSKEDINHLAPQDLGQLLQFTSGVSMRSYGGIGGMKTIALRGLGGEHTGLIVNGLPQKNAQNAQTDFGTVQVDNLEEVSVHLGPSSSALLPVSAQLLGNAIEITTFENSFTRERLEGRASILRGSYGQQDAFLAAKTGWSKGFISVSGKYRKSDGNYDYRIPMVSNYYEGVRKNNALEEYFIAFGGGFRTVHLKEGKATQMVKWNVQKEVSDKELPGAVILYNDFANQTLKTENTRMGITHTIKRNQFKSVHFVNWNKHELEYNDPSFLNADGFLFNRYVNNGMSGGANAQYSLKKSSVFSGIEFKKEQLTGNRTDFGVPNRITFNSNIGAKYSNRFMVITSTLFYQMVQDENRLVYHSLIDHRLNPQLEIQTSEKWNTNIQFNAWVKKSMRPPSFNELYYSQIGNISLVPEDAWQSNIGGRYRWSNEKWALGLRVNGFYNQVTDKIVALPTKNLFVWSVQNVGAVSILGSDFNANSMLEWNKHWKWNSSVAVTFQSVQDITDSESPTYRHQLAYMPKWSGSWLNSLIYKRFSLHTTLFALGERYSLNQNIPSNKIDGFWLVDLSLAYDIKLKSTELTLQGGIRNVTDRDYVFIRSFVMPGRNYFIQLRYEF